jgi:hypothetical protein
MPFGEIKSILDNEEKSKQIWKLQKKIDYLKNKDKIIYCSDCGKHLKYYSYKKHYNRFHN